MASTHSYFDAKTQAWKDLPTVWVSVKAHRTLANNVMASLHKGDPIIVVGSLGMDVWTKDGQSQSALVIEASAIGHDLSLGATRFEKLGRGKEVKISSGFTEQSAMQGMHHGTDAHSSPISAEAYLGEATCQPTSSGVVF
jgi:single-strand DNA-binding protein